MFRRNIFCNIEVGDRKVKQVKNIESINFTRRKSM